MLPIPYEMPKIITKYINIYLKIDSIVTRSLIALGLDHAERAITMFPGLQVFTCLSEIGAYVTARSLDENANH